MQKKMPRPRGDEPPPWRRKAPRIDGPPAAPPPAGPPTAPQPAAERRRARSSSKAAKEEEEQQQQAAKAEVEKADEGEEADSDVLLVEHAVKADEEEDAVKADEEEEEQQQATKAEEVEQADESEEADSDLELAERFVLTKLAELAELDDAAATRLAEVAPAETTAASAFAGEPADGSPRVDPYMRKHRLGAFNFCMLVISLHSSWPTSIDELIQKHYCCFALIHELVLHMRSTRCRCCQLLRRGVDNRGNDWKGVVQLGYIKPNNPLLAISMLKTVAQREFMSRVPAPVSTRTD